MLYNFILLCKHKINNVYNLEIEKYLIIISLVNLSNLQANSCTPNYKPCICRVILHSNSYHLLFEQLLPKLFYLSSLLLALKSKLFLAQPLDIGMEPIEKELMIGTSKLVLASFKTNLKKKPWFFFSCVTKALLLVFWLAFACCSSNVSSGTGAIRTSS